MRSSTKRSTLIQCPKLSASCECYNLTFGLSLLCDKFMGYLQPECIYFMNIHEDLTVHYIKLSYIALAEENTLSVTVITYTTFFGFTVFCNWLDVYKTGTVSWKVCEIALGCDVSGFAGKKWNQPRVYYSLMFMLVLLLASHFTCHYLD